MTVPSPKFVDDENEDDAAVDKCNGQSRAVLSHEAVITRSPPARKSAAMTTPL